MILKLIIILISVWVILRLFATYSKKKIDTNSFVIWVLIWGGIIFTVLHPVWSERLSKVLKIGRGTDIAFFLAIVLIFYLLFRLYVKINVVESEITEIIKHIALINHKINKTNVKSEKKNSKKKKT